LEPILDGLDPKSIPPGITVIASIANSSMPRDLLLRSGGFDEEILAAEDLELKLRLWKMGASFRYQPAAVAYELYDKSSWQYLWIQARALGAGDIRICRKHPEYRPYSALSSLATTSRAKRWLRSALMRSPVSPVWFLALPLRLEKWFYRCGPLRSAGVHLFSLAARIAQLRSALSVAGSYNALEKEFGIVCPALMYHHVGPSHPGTHRELTVSPTQFERQIRWLARWGYTGIRPSDWLRWRREGTGLPRKPILITFDDGYAETAEYALPILRRYGFGAAVFVVTERIGGTNTWDEAEGRGTLQLMTAEQIRHWAAEGIEFGAHSRTHADLTQLPAHKCAAETSGSKSDLETLLGAPVVSFAYPYGHVSESVRDLVRAEFDLAFGVDEGLNCLSGDPHLLKRRYVGPDDLLLDVAVGFRWRREARWLSDLRIKLALRSRLKKALGRLDRRSSDRA
jgi:peptidoglycan/xylan/chitin deacetylase (PgdA/CDA1 family)